MKLNPLSYYSKTDHIKNVKKIILLPFFTLFVNCEMQQRNCKDFYTGTFYSETIVDGKKYKLLMTEPKKLQKYHYKDWYKLAVMYQQRTKKIKFVSSIVFGKPLT